MITPKVNYRSLFNQCVLCKNHSCLPSGFCEACTNDLPWLNNGCSICSIPISNQNGILICAECQKRPPFYDNVTALFEYSFPINKLIGKIKYSHQPQLIGHLAALTADRIKLNPELETLIPIPMHCFSRFKRGFNQAELLASELSKHINIPVDRNCLVKIKKTERQMQLPRSSRLNNPKGAFKCRPINYESVMLIDDVMTTGATLNEAARCLKSAGVKHVEAIVIARTEH
ncbi:ComF family protein [Neptuniibacter sp.]|uniref:ComF family protein n=1 Tax=Neptuniibacter sp. TaxID=1962643 RepID=UPI003B5ABA44